MDNDNALPYNVENFENTIRVNDPRSSFIQTASKSMLDISNQSGILNESPILKLKKHDGILINKKFLARAKDEGKIMNETHKEVKAYESKVKMNS